MLNIVQSHAPRNWTSDNQIGLNRLSDDYKQIECEVRCVLDDSSRIKSLTRVQDLYAFGQFLIREQLLINLHSKLYRVRRYLHVSKCFFNEIIKYNLDPRRCGLGTSLTFHKQLSHCPGQLLVVVKVLTTNPNEASVSPAKSSDYYVEYIVEF